MVAAAAASSAMISAARLSGVSKSDRERLLEVVERSDGDGEGGTCKGEGGGGVCSRGRGGEAWVAAAVSPAVAPV